MKLKKSGPDDLKKAVTAINAGAVAAAGIVTGNPGLGAALGMAAALYGPAIERRRDRAEQMVRFVEDSLAEFASGIFEDKAFQDGFVFLLEKHIRERNDDKRLILQQVLLGYANAPKLLDFPLEEMADLVSRIRMSDVAVLRSALLEESKHGTREDDSRMSVMLREDPNAVSRLIYFGLLFEDREKNGPRVREYDDKSFLYVWVSPTGREFAKYLGVPPIEPVMRHPNVL